MRLGGPVFGETSNPDSGQQRSRVTDTVLPTVLSIQIVMSQPLTRTSKPRKKRTSSLQRSVRGAIRSALMIRNARLR